MFNNGTGGYINSNSNKYLKLSRGNATSIGYYRNESYLITDQASGFLAIATFTNDGSVKGYIHTIYGNPYLSVAQCNSNDIWLESSASWNRLLTVYSLNGYKPTVTVQNNLN